MREKAPERVLFCVFARSACGGITRRLRRRGCNFTVRRKLFFRTFSHGRKSTAKVPLKGEESPLSNPFFDFPPYIITRKFVRASSLPAPANRDVCACEHSFAEWLPMRLFKAVPTSHQLFTSRPLVLTLAKLTARFFSCGVRLISPNG